MTAHKHAALMLQYAQDAAETDKPHERWEFRCPGDIAWKAFTSTNPIWLPDLEYRRRPRTMTYTVTIPEPLREALNEGEEYFVAAPHNDDFYFIRHWCDDRFDKMWLERGLLFATREDAAAAAKAMLPFKVEGA